ncbi:hypothetical protein RISK_006459 [Rhodopirellula islandica]|uniref:Ice-binding protein C-terminal domain-containing protein n=1 Tax=Rhodopirellula islandica TaxID=595434 RepID=A0A0J1B3W7_RHOIS|nr:PEP-CTERM sorting domain-containing protein [Rhodopirellula islandica]KLU01303.1 hypothetical protein RISK_006459 [Rhodopirellula islandica]
MIRFFTVLSMTLVTSNAFAAFVFEIDTLNGVDSTTSFVSGDVVTVRVNLVDLGVSDPDFTDDTLQAFTATISSSNAEPNIGLPVAFNPLFAASTNATGADLTAVGGIGFAGIAPGYGFSAGTSTSLFEFSYVAGAVGDTTFDFVAGVGRNSANFSEDGETFPFNEFDASLGAARTISVTAVPEPASFVMLGMIGSGVVAYRRRRGQKALAC